MSDLQINCHEPENRPHRAQLTLRGGERKFKVYLFNDHKDPRHVGAKLRWTTLAGVNDPAPPDTELLVTVDVVDDPKDSARRTLSLIGLKPGFKLTRSSSGLEQGVNDTTCIPIGAELTLTLPKETPPPGAGSDEDKSAADPSHQLQLSLEALTVLTRGAEGASMGLEAPDDLALADAAKVLWALPTAAGAFASPSAKVSTAVKTFAKRLKLPPGLMAPLLVGLTLVLGMGYATLMNHWRANDAEALLAEREEALTNATAQRDLALAAERTCLGEREELTVELKDAKERLDTILDQVLRRTEILTLAASLMGERAQGEAAQRFDDQGLKMLKERLAEQLPHTRVEATLAAPCRDQQDVLGQDLPSYALLWHPDAELFCPEGYSDRDAEQVLRVGRWGLSDRAALVYGEEFVLGAEGLDDLRLRDAWSARAHAAGLRETLRGVLMAKTPGGRPPVAPSAAALWALALWDAYNHMPMPADNTSPERAGVCVALLIETLARAQRVTEPGQPVLPDLTVALGEPLGDVEGTTACDWTEARIQQGAARALQAVAREAALKLATPEEGA